MLAGFEDVVVANVAKGEKIVMTGFLTFDRGERAARTGRNPQTGEAIKIAASKNPKVSAGASFKKIVNGKEPAPEAQQVTTKSLPAHAGPGIPWAGIVASNEGSELTDRLVGLGDDPNLGIDAEGELLEVEHLVGDGRRVTAANGVTGWR